MITLNLIKTSYCIKNYQNKCQIIKKWDELFDKIKEHIQSLSSMRMSPYYKVKCFIYKCFQDVYNQ